MLYGFVNAVVIISFRNISQTANALCTRISKCTHRYNDFNSAPIAPKVYETILLAFILYAFIFFTEHDALWSQYDAFFVRCILPIYCIYFWNRRLWCIYYLSALWNSSSDIRSVGGKNPGVKQYVFRKNIILEGIELYKKKKTFSYIDTLHGEKAIACGVQTRRQ